MRIVLCLALWASTSAWAGLTSPFENQISRVEEADVKCSSTHGGAPILIDLDLKRAWQSVGNDEQGLELDVIGFSWKPCTQELMLNGDLNIEPHYPHVVLEARANAKTKKFEGHVRYIGANDSARDQVLCERINTWRSSLLLEQARCGN